MYLQNWSKNNKIKTYQLLVPNDKVPIWKNSSILHTGSLSNLYVRVENGQEVDDFEEMFNRRFESRVTDALFRACRDLELSMNDWEKLIDFTAAQIVRTPAFYEKLLPIMTNTFEEGIKDIARKLESFDGEKIEHTYHEDIGLISLPLKVTKTGLAAGENEEYVEINGVVGKSTWLWAVEHLLTNTSQILHQYNWSILICNDKVEWPTSDNPVICLNYYKDDTYDFGGGWGRTGSEIIFPISPNRALYVQVGKKHSARVELSRETSLKIKRLIVENAFRYVYANVEDMEIPKIRERIVDLEKYTLDKANLHNWYEVYKSEEGRFYG